MPEDQRPLIFDTGPLSHFSKEGWLGLLKAIVGNRPAYVPDVVRHELGLAVDEHTHLRAVLEADWIQTVAITELRETVAFARYSARMVVGDRHVGECGVLAIAEVRGWEAVVDDRVARNLGAEFGVLVTGTVALLCQGIRSHGLTVALASTVADDLLAGEYRLPFDPGGFEAWASQQGMLES